MAKGKENKGVSGMGFGPVSGRLPTDYGKQLDLNATGMSMPQKSNITRARETSKEFSKGSPHPKAKQGEGPIGRKEFGADVLGVKETHFNHHRSKAHEMEGHVDADCSTEY